MILDHHTAEKKLNRMAMEIAEQNADAKELVLMGIVENGMHITHRIHHYLKPVFKGDIFVSPMFINKKSPLEVHFDTPFSLQGKTIILIDDVANSGRTMMYALKPIMEQQPEKIQTLALVERMHKMFPIALNFIGLSLSTSPQEHIEVIVENDHLAGAKVVPHT